MKEIIKFDFNNPPMRDESIFWSENDPRWEGENGMSRPNGRVLDMENESFVWCFTGARRNGKSSYMTYIAEKAAYLYNKRIVSNYPIALDVRRKDMSVLNIRSEQLDLAKLFTFDGYYQDALIVLDEAPQTINRLATMSWKNRLLDLYLQTLGHDNVSMLYASQNEELDHGWVDGALRFQTDILVYCRDAYVRYHGDNLLRGSMILANLLDKSGAWTGYSYYERPKVYKRRILTELIWGTFDTHQRYDVLESLAGVNMDIKKFKVTNKTGVEDEKPPYLDRLADTLDMAAKAGKMKVVDFYDSIGDLAHKDKTKIGHLLRKAGVTKGGANSGTFDFTNLDIDRVLSQGRAE